MTRQRPKLYRQVSALAPELRPLAERFLASLPAPRAGLPSTPRPADRLWCGHSTAAVVTDDAGVEVCATCSGLEPGGAG